MDRLTVLMVFVATITLYHATTITYAKEIAAVKEPGTGFRGDVFSCHVCHPNMTMCEGRADCCVTPNEDHIQACPKLPETACYKTQSFDGQFYNVTRGCGKRTGQHAVGQAVTGDCVYWGSDSTNFVCNCDKTTCNSGHRNFISMSFVAVVCLLRIVS